jgi:hypothetical protein
MDATKLAERIAKSRPDAITNLNIEEKDLIVRALGYCTENEHLRMLIVRWLNGGDSTLAQDSRDAINPRWAINTGEGT